MKMNVYADKYAQNTRKGDMEKKIQSPWCVWLPGFGIYTEGSL